MKATIYLNPFTLHVLRDINKNFTELDLTILSSLKSVHSIRLYRLLKQYESTGYLSMSLESFKKKMSIPENYRNNNIWTKIIVVAVNELSEYFDGLSATVDKLNAPGKPIKGYSFHWNPTKRLEKKEKSVKKITDSKKNKFTDFEMKQDYGDLGELEKKLLANQEKTL